MSNDRVKFSNWLLDIPGITLAEGEEIVLVTWGSRLNLPSAYRGNLILTSERLLHQAVGSRHQATLLSSDNPPIDLSLGEIASVRRATGVRAFITRLLNVPWESLFIVTLKDGRSYTFSAGFGGFWVSEIERLKSEQTTREQVGEDEEPTDT